MPFIHNDYWWGASEVPVPVAFVRGFTPRCDDCLCEAEERMRTGGIAVTPLINGYLVSIGGKARWVPNAAC